MGFQKFVSRENFINDNVTNVEREIGKKNNNKEVEKEKEKEKERE